MNVAGSSVRRTQESMVTMAASPGKTQTGRVAQGKVVTIQTLGQMAARSDTTPRQATTDYTVVVTGASGPARRATRTKKPARSEMMECRSKANKNVQTAVQRSVQKLTEAWKEKKFNALLFCRDVVSEMDNLAGQYCDTMDIGNENYQLIVNQLGPHYTTHLKKALEELNREINTGYGVAYDKLLVSMIRYSMLQPDKDHDDERDDKKLLRDTCQRLIQKEMDYLYHIKTRQDASFINAATYSCGIINRLTAFDSLSVCTDLFINKEGLTNTRKEASRITAAILRLPNDKNTDVDENIKKLKEDLLCETGDVWAARQYHDRLWLLLTELRTTIEQDKSLQTCILVFRKLCDIHYMCTGLFEKFFSPCRKTVELISCTTKRILTASLDDCVQLDKDVMELMDTLMVEESLSADCKTFYLLYKELQTEMRTVAQTDTITTDVQCMKHITEIRLRLDNKTDADYLAAAEMLRQFLFGHWHEIQSLDTATLRMNDIKEIKNTLCEELFTPVIKELRESKKESLEKKSKKINKKRARFAQLGPYLFVVSNKNDKDLWMKSVGIAWYHDLDTLARRRSFREQDVDHLLELKRTVPNAPNPCIRILLKETLTRLLSYILNMKDGNSEIPVEKVAAISQWINDFPHLKVFDNMRRTHSDDQLKKLNNLWKTRKNKDTIPGVTPDRPVSSTTLMQPESEEPSTSRLASSSVPTVEASAAKKNPGTRTLSPESRTGFKRFKRDPSFVADFSETTEQPVLATTGLETVTTRASQASSFLQGANPDISQTNKGQASYNLLNAS